MLNPEEITPAAVCRRVKDVLIKVQSRVRYNDIRMKHSLQATYGLGPQARLGLAAKSNDRFVDLKVRIPEAEVGASITVQKLFLATVKAVQAVDP